MKARTVALVMLLALPGAAALGLLGGGPTQPAATADPPGCVVEPVHALCRWTLDTRPPNSVGRNTTFYVPAFDRTLTHVTVVFQGDDQGWAVDLRSNVGGQWSTSRSTHEPGVTPTTEARSSSDHLLPGNATDAHQLVFNTGYRSPVPKAFTSTRGDAPLSVGVFTIVYDAVPLPLGTPPARPAASRDFPQVPGRPNDARNASVDLLAAWIDDARLDDATIDAHFGIADLRSLDFSTPVDPTGRIGTAVAIHYDLHFKVLGIQYLVEVSATPGDPETAWTAHLARNESGSWQDVAALLPQVDAETGEISVVFPVAAIGAPGDGDTFEELNANIDTEYNVGGYRQQDDGGVARFPFALGGPAVWDPLNGCHFCPPHLAWWQDPLASDNLPNTVQVGGAVVAVVAFFAGLILLRNRREKVRALLREIEAAEIAHERDTRAALLALGALDSKFADMYHKGALNDDQYQVVAQRLATAATRFALRQGLGLDDGAAGDRASVSVPVRDADAAAGGAAAAEREARS